MDPEALSAINQNAYRAALMLIQAITAIVGVASAMLVVISLVCAACDSFVEVRRSARRQIKPRSLSEETPFGCKQEVNGFSASIRFPKQVVSTSELKVFSSQEETS